MENINVDPIVNDFNPLEESVIQRDYTKPNVAFGEVDPTPIQEPVFTPPSFEQYEASQNISGFENDAVLDEKASANPHMEPLDNKDTRLAASAMVDAVLDGYAMINKLASNYVKPPIDKVQNLMRTGDIDPSLTIPINGRELGVLEYLNAYGEELGNVFTVDEEFRGKVRPPMIREFMKRNIGMTDLQQIGFYFISDAGTKVALGYNIIKQNNVLIQSLIDVSQGRAPQPTPQASSVNYEPTEPVEPTRKKSTPTKEREYVEPEEVGFEVEEFTEPVNVRTANDDVNRGRRPMKQPEFGDDSILSHMEQVANGGSKAKKGRGRPRKN
jgi:hypothetical protein